MQPLLSIQNLSVDFLSSSGNTNAVKQISFDIKRNEVVALVGESGSGKSVTSLSILQLIPSPPAQYSTGEILFFDDNEQQHDLLKCSKTDLQDIRGNKIAMIFQEPMTSLNPVFTCGTQVMEALLRHKKISKNDAHQQTIQWFEKMKLPEPEVIFKKYPHQLSGGQKQRVMIAMTMCCNPSLLICDEPTTALDVTVQKTILELIKDLQRQTGMGVLFITHDLGVVAEIADKVLVMYKGEIVEQNSVQEIFKNAKHPYTQALLACRPINHKKGNRLPVVSDFLNPGNKKNTLLQPSTNHNEKSTAHETLVDVTDLSVWFPNKKSFFGKPLAHIKAVDQVSFQVFKGETLGLVGESGCGKTTMGRTLLKLIEPNSGKIVFNGTDLKLISKKDLHQLRKDIQIIFQDPYSSLNPRMTIGDAISEPLKVHKLTPNARKRKDQVMELLERVDLKAAHFNRYPHEFSGGQRQRIVIARALILNPSFIVCDESVSALDVSVQAQVLNLLNDLKNEMGFTNIFISHDLSVVRYISDRIIVMNKGKIEESGQADDIFYHPQTAYSKKLIAAIPKGKYC